MRKKKVPTMKAPISVGKRIECTGCNSLKDNLYYISEDGPLCHDCFRKKHPELFRKVQSKGVSRRRKRK